MRARPQRSGTIYYYFDVGGTPRREIPLGADFVEAVRKWSELEAQSQNRHAQLVTFRYAAERYVREVLPVKARRTQRDNLLELENLYKFFDELCTLRMTYFSVSGPSQISRHAMQWI